jgi:hypothetical protein
MEEDGEEDGGDGPIARFDKGTAPLQDKANAAAISPALNDAQEQLLAATLAGYDLSTTQHRNNHRVSCQVRDAHRDKKWQIHWREAEIDPNCGTRGGRCSAGTIEWGATGGRSCKCLQVCVDLQYSKRCSDVGMLCVRCRLYERGVGQREADSADV